MNVAMISFSGTITEIHYLTQLTSALLDSGRVGQIILALPEYTNVKELTKGVCVYRFPFPISLPKAMIGAFNPFLHRALLQRISSVNPDVVHIVFEFRVPCLLVSALHHKHPVVTTVHEPKPTIHTLPRMIVLNPIQSANTRLVMKFSDKIMVHGHKHEDYLVANKVPRHKIRVVPHGDFSFFNRRARKETDIQSSNILFFGKVTPYKGIEYLIQAAKIIEQQFPGVTITIAGEGGFARYEKLIRGDRHFVVHNRFISDEEVGELFSKASVVVLPYIDGSQSSIISIAGTFKKPVVATDVGNFSEMVQDRKTGFIVPPKDINALAEAIIKLLRDEKLRQELGENAYKMVREEFSWDDIARQALQVYQEAIEAREALERDGTRKSQEGNSSS